MPRLVHVKVVGKLDGTGRLVEGVMIIDRSAELVSIRPKRRRRLYTLPLSTVADMVCARVIKAELLEKRLEKARLRKMRRSR